MGFVNAIKACFSKYAQFSGRARRSEFWWFFLFVAVATSLLSAVDGQIFGIDPATEEPRRVLAGLFQLVTILPLLAVAWRRMHDSGLPGWYVLLPVLFSFVVVGSVLGSAFVYPLIEMIGNQSDVFILPAVVAGATGVMLVAIAQLVLFLLMLYWLTRRSDPNPNRYGPA